MGTGAWTVVNLGGHISNCNELYIRVFAYTAFILVSDFINHPASDPIVVSANGSGDANIIMVGYLNDGQIHVYIGSSIGTTSNPVLLMGR